MRLDSEATLISEAAQWHFFIQVEQRQVSLLTNRDSLFTIVLRLLCSRTMGCMRKMGPLLYHISLENLGGMWPLSYVWLSVENPDLGLSGGWPRQERTWGRVLASLYME